jgi:hypothetical protein
MVIIGCVFVAGADKWAKRSSRSRIACPPSARMDRLIVLERGRIVEEGSH